MAQNTPSCGPSTGIRREHPDPAWALPNRQDELLGPGLVGWRDGLQARVAVQVSPPPTLPSTVSFVAGRARSPRKSPRQDPLRDWSLHSQDTSSWGGGSSDLGPQNHTFCRSASEMAKQRYSREVGGGLGSLERCVGAGPGGVSW